MTESLKADTTVKGIILLTLPISLARLVPELNFLFNAIFWVTLEQRNWLMQLFQVCIISFLRQWAMA